MSGCFALGSGYRIRTNFSDTYSCSRPEEDITNPPATGVIQGRALRTILRMVIEVSQYENNRTYR